jgi:beta-galactosidase
MLEDVWTQNDFSMPMAGPRHPRYLVTENNGHMYPTKHIDNVERVVEHVLRHARIHNQVAAEKPTWPHYCEHYAYAGALSWCAFDYNTHKTFGSGDRICYHGVSDIFRIPKPAAGFYKSQCEPREEVVLEPAFNQWACGDLSGGGGVGPVVVCSNCDELRFYLGERLISKEEPDRKNFPHLAHPPFRCEKLMGVWGDTWLDLRIDGYVKGRKVITRTFSANGVDADFILQADDAELIGDGIDATRVVFKVADEYGNTRPFATGAVQLDIQGPGEIIGENPFALTGGVGAVWVRTKQGSGVITLQARHPQLGGKRIRIKARKAAQPALS